MSVCWLALVGHNAYSDLSWLYTKKRFEVTIDGIGSADFLFSAAQSATDIKDHINEELIPLIEQTPKDYVGKTNATPYDKYIGKHARTEIFKYMKVALFPILGLLVLGWSFVWVRRGFKAKSNA
jgi:hypothetical protein